MRNYQQKSFDEIFGRVLGRTTMTTTTNQKVYIDKCSMFMNFAQTRLPENEIMSIHFVNIKNEPSYDTKTTTDWPLKLMIFYSSSKVN